ncbi:ArsR family transcriptional regulator [Micromonospora endolithica]|uniref:ArsR family transcriptional regulator n=1 Tax=Micromonospora endolithica TaxID=230091 RepID=A0A3A9ZS96_9ACTN|nr:ArsR family transcriptional regulator [Micromonospora endolithica]
MPAETVAVLAPAFKALGDPVRLRLMSMIASAEGGEACVCDLTPAFGLTGPTISHHLRRPLPGVPRQAVRGLEADRPGGQGRGGTPDPGRAPGPGGEAAR